MGVIVWNFYDLKVSPGLTEQSTSDDVFQFIKQRCAHSIKSHVVYYVTLSCSRASLYRYEYKDDTEAAHVTKKPLNNLFVVSAVITFADRYLTKSFLSLVPRVSIKN